jgi:phosphoribosylglycinamide formyltransferase-1
VHDGKSTRKALEIECAIDVKWCAIARSNAVPKAQSKSKAKSKPHSKKKAKRDPRLERVTTLALELPETSRYLHGDHAGFTVRAKKFAYFLNNHHGDGIVGLACKVMPGDNNSLAAAQPERYYMPAYVGAMGWVGLRLDRGTIDWDEVRELLRGSYVLLAPKKLAQIVLDEAENEE